MQWLICKKNKCGNAERQRREYRGATGVGCGEQVSFSPDVWAGGYAPSPEIFFEIFIPKWRVLVQYEVLFATFHSLLLHAN